MDANAYDSIDEDSLAEYDHVWNAESNALLMSLKNECDKKQSELQLNETERSVICNFIQATWELEDVKAQVWEPESEDYRERLLEKEKKVSEFEKM